MKRITKKCKSYKIENKTFTVITETDLMESNFNRVQIIFSEGLGVEKEIGDYSGFGVEKVSELMNKVLKEASK